MTKKKKKEKLEKCSTCERKFSLDEEGGTTGLFGMIPVAFCPECLSSCLDMAEQFEQY